MDRVNQCLLIDDYKIACSKITYVYSYSNGSEYGHYKAKSKDIAVVLKRIEGNLWQLVNIEDKARFPKPLNASTSKPLNASTSKPLKTITNRPLKTISNTRLKSEEKAKPINRPPLTEHKNKQHTVKSMKQFDHQPVIAYMDGFKYGYTPSITTKKG